MSPEEPMADLDKKRCAMRGGAAIARVFLKNCFREHLGFPVT